jgi:type IV pilus assembly protein PilW
MKAVVINSPHRNAGFSLVELMVAMLLGTLVTAAAVQIFSMTHSTFQLQRGLTDVQEQGRFAVDFISRDLRIMGLRESGATPVGVEINDVAVGGKVFPAAADGDVNTGFNDRLTFSFFGRVTDTDCEGNSPLVDETLIVNTYWVQDGSLRCNGSLDPGSIGLELVAGVDSFQVLYGIDTVVDEIPFASRYLRADELVPGQQIVVVRIGLLVRAGQEGLVAQGPPQTMVVLDRQLNAGTAPLDVPAVRRLFISTVRVRNLEWINI